MSSPIEVRSKQLPVEGDNVVTLMKVNLPEATNFNPRAIELNGHWYVLADIAQAMNETASWESMKSAA